MSTKGNVLKLSIIVPAYNEEKLITGCLEHISKAAEANVSAGDQGMPRGRLPPAAAG
jgi:hypothetical protein